MGTFGRRSNERPAGGGGEIFIKTFKDPRTLVWFLQDDPDTWVEYKQHFDNGAKRGWPCAIHEGANNCVGCEFPTDDPDDDQSPGTRVRSTASRWVFPVIDEKGYVSLYMCGFKLWSSLKELYKEYETLTDAQYAIRRSGSTFNDITYTATKTDNRQKPEAKVAIPDDEYISNILGKQYVEAIERYEYDPNEGHGEPAEHGQPDPDPVPPERSGDVASEALAAAKTTAAKKSPAKKAGGVKGAHVAKADEAQAEHQSGEAPAFDDMGLGELKDWLDEAKVDYPKNAGRPVLLGLAKQAADKPPF